jgi:hypothetical protein
MKKWIVALAVLLAFGTAAPAAALTGQSPQDTVKMVIQPQYSYAFPFSEGLAAVAVDDKIGFIDRNGNFVIRPAFDGRQASATENGLYMFREGRALFRDNGKYGYLDKRGKIVIEAKYDRAFPFQQGLAAVVKDGKLGYIDRNGNTVIPHVYHYDPLETENPSFQDGLAKVATKSGNTILYGFIDTTGKEAIPPREWLVEPFSDGLALVRDSSGGKLELYYIDTAGKKVLDLTGRYSRAYGFYSGMARVEKDGKIGYINKNGREIVSPSYTYALNFSEERALAKIDNAYVLIDRNGKESERLAYSYIEKFGNGLAMVESVTWDFSAGKLKQERKTGYIDPAGKEVIPPQFDKGQGFSEGLAAVQIDGLWGYIAKPGLEQPSDWAKAELAEAAALGLIPQGMDQGFRNAMTRAEFAGLAVHLLTVAWDKPVDDMLKERGAAVDPHAFRDTRDETVLAAHALGIISGRGNGIFDPEGAINRQEAALMLAQTANLLGVQPGGKTETFADADEIAPWAREAVTAVSAIFDPFKEVPVMTSTGNGRFSPKSAYEKQQALITVKRLYQAKRSGD